MPKGLPVGEEEITDMRGLAEENPSWTYDQIADELVRLGYPRRHKSVIHRYVRDIREGQAREGIEEQKAEARAVGNFRELDEIDQKLAREDLHPKIKQILENRLDDLLLEGSERERLEKEIAEKDQHIEDLSQRLLKAERNWGYLYGEAEKWKVEAEVMRQYKRRCIFLESKILGSGVVEAIFNKGKSPTLFYNEYTGEYFGMYDYDVHSFFKLEEILNEASRRVKLLDDATNRIAELEGQIAGFNGQINTLSSSSQNLERETKMLSQTLFSVGTSLREVISGLGVVKDEKLDFYVQSEKVYRLTVEGKELVSLQVCDTLPTNGILLGDWLLGIIGLIQKGIQKQFDDRLSAFKDEASSKIDEKVAEVSARVDRLAEDNKKMAEQNKELTQKFEIALDTIEEFRRVIHDFIRKDYNQSEEKALNLRKMYEYPEFAFVIHPNGKIEQLVYEEQIKTARAEIERERAEATKPREKKTPEAKSKEPSFYDILTHDAMTMLGVASGVKKKKVIKPAQEVKEKDKEIFEVARGRA